MKKILVLIPLLALLAFPFAVHAESYPDGCTATTKYSATTGQPCQKPACSPGDLFNSMTGQKCNDASSTLPEGCTTIAGFSPLTGKKCDDSVAAIITSQNIISPIEVNTVPISNGDIKLITKDLGDSYDFDAYLYDQYGNNINLMANNFANNKYKNSKVTFTSKAGISNKNWGAQQYDENGYYFSYTVLKNKVDGTSMTVSFPIENLSKTFSM